jgi:hypothetical protein
MCEVHTCVKYLDLIKMNLLSKRAQIQKDFFKISETCTVGSNLINLANLVRLVHVCKVRFGQVFDFFISLK